MRLPWILRQGEQEDCQPQLIIIQILVIKPLSAVWLGIDKQE